MVGYHDGVFLVTEKIDRRLLCLGDECVGLSLAASFFFFRPEAGTAGINAVSEFLVICGRRKLVECSA